jgi:hypothetical protein
MPDTIPESDRELKPIDLSRLGAYGATVLSIGGNIMAGCGSGTSFIQGRMYISAVKNRPRVMGGVSGRRRKHRPKSRKGKRCRTEKP